MRPLDAERGEHRVPGELLDDPAVHGNAVRDGLEELGDATPDDLRVAPDDEARGVDQVDEQDRGKLSLHR